MDEWMKVKKMNDDSNLNKEIENLFIYTEILLLLLFLLNNKTKIYNK